jgi:anaerobic nitric oxide reductase transcription regulator
VRVFAATNRELEEEVKRGRFRADLLHRLDVCRVRVPPLREHREDIPQLAGHFADRARRRLGTGPIRVAADARDALTRGTWRGNVRELENALSRAILRAVGRTAAGETVIVRAEDLAAEALAESRVASAVDDAPLREGKSLRDALREYEKRLIERALAANGGNWAAAARSLGVHRSNLHHLAKRLGLR